MIIPSGIAILTDITRLIFYAFFGHLVRGFLIHTGMVFTYASPYHFTTLTCGCLWVRD